MNPVPTPAPLHDIVGPVEIPGLPLWVSVVATLVLLGVGLTLLAIFGKRRKRFPSLSPAERAFKALASLRTENPDSYTFGVKVSDILRTYIRDHHGLDATTRTSLEFLEVLKEHPVFTDEERSALADFLQASDLLKFARVEAADEEKGQMLALAERLVSGGRHSSR